MPRKKNTYLFIGVVIIIVNFLFMFNPFRSDSRNKSNTREEGRVAVVETTTVELTSLLQRTYSASGTLEPFAEVTVYPRVTGRLDKFMISNGQAMRRGQTIAEIDHREIDSQLEINKAELSSAESSLRHSTVERERYRKLMQEGFATRQQFDDKETLYLQSKAEVQRSRAEVQKQSVTRSEYFLQSPIDGIVLDDYSLTPGDMITSSTPITKIGVVQKLKAVVMVPSTKAAELREGMKVKISVSEIPGCSFDGSLMTVAPSVDVSTRTTRIEIGVENQEGKLKPGMFSEAMIILEEEEDVLVVPTIAVSEKDGTLFVLTVIDGAVEEQVIRAGIRTEKDTQILQGLEKGDQVVVSGGLSLSQGDRVSTE